MHISTYSNKFLNKLSKEIYETFNRLLPITIKPEKISDQIKMLEEKREKQLLELQKVKLNISDLNKAISLLKIKQN